MRSAEHNETGKLHRSVGTSLPGKDLHCSAKVGDVHGQPHAVRLDSMDSTSTT